MKNNNLTITNKGWLSVLAIFTAILLTILEMVLNSGQTNNNPLVQGFIFLTYCSFFLLINVDVLSAKMRKTRLEDLLFTLTGFLHILIVVWLLINLGKISNKDWLEIFSTILIVNVLAYITVIISTINLFTYWNKITVPRNKLLFLNNVAYFPGEELNIGPIRYPKNIILLNNIQELENIQQDIICQEGLINVYLNIKVRILIEKGPRYSPDKDISTPLTTIRQKLIVRLMDCSKEVSLIQNIKKLIPLGEIFNSDGYKFELKEKNITIKATK